MIDSDVAMMERANGRPLGGSPLDIFDRLASVEGADIEKLGRLLEYDRQWRADRAEEAFKAAKSRVANRVPTVVRDADNPHTKSRFARLEAIAKAIKPIYADEGFSTSAHEGETTRDPEQYVRVILTVDHRDGHSKSVWMDVARDGKGAKGGQPAMNATQACGSTFTYGRRYLTVQFFDVTIADEDTDGNVDDRPIESDELAELEALVEEYKATGLPFIIRKFMDVFAGPACQAVSDFSYRQFIEAKADLKRRLDSWKKEKGK